MGFDDGNQLVAAAQRRDAASWAERDQVLDALLDLADVGDVLVETLLVGGSQVAS